MTAAHRDPDPRPLHELVNDVRHAEVRLAIRPYWPLTDPSIAAGADGFSMLVRGVNVLWSDDGGCTLLDRSRTTRSLLYLTNLDDDLSVTDVVLVYEPSTEEKRWPSTMRGLTDARLVQTQTGFVVAAATHDLDLGGPPRLVVLDLEGHTLSDMRPVQNGGSAPSACGWLPFTKGHRLHFLASLSPIAVLDEDGKVAHGQEPESSPLDGGSQGVEIDPGILFVVHERADGVSAQRHHRFVLMDHSFGVIGVSPRFSFLGRADESCLGLAVRGRDCVLSFDIAQRHALIAMAPLASILSLLSQRGVGA